MWCAALCVGLCAALYARAKPGKLTPRALLSSHWLWSHCQQQDKSSKGDVKTPFSQPPKVLAHFASNGTHRLGGRVDQSNKDVLLLSDPCKFILVLVSYFLFFSETLFGILNLSKTFMLVGYLIKVKLKTKLWKRRACHWISVACPFANTRPLTHPRLCWLCIALHFTWTVWSNSVGTKRAAAAELVIDGRMFLLCFAYWLYPYWLSSFALLTGYSLPSAVGGLPSQPA